MLTNYITKYWNGNYSPEVSLWFNLIPIYVIFQLCFFTAHNLFSQTASLIEIKRYVLVIIILLAVYASFVIWITTGAYRSLRSLKHRSWVYVQFPLYCLIIVACFMFALLQIKLHFKPTKQLLLIALQEDPISRAGYKFSVHGTKVKFTGSFSFGTAQDLKNILKDNKNIQTISFESDGGYISSALKVEQVISDYKLNTYVGTFCYSACTFAFLGGNERTLSYRGRLGFHAPHMPGIPASYSYISSDSLQTFMNQKRISPAFIRKAFSTHSKKLWYPDKQLLINSGYVTKVEKFGVKL